MKPPKVTTGIQWTTDKLRYHFDMLNRTLKRISFGSTTANTDQDMNMDAYKATGTSPATANTEFAIPHNLGRVPIGFIVLNTNIAGHLYKSTGTPWSATTIYLMSNVSSITYTIAIL